MKYLRTFLQGWRWLWSKRYTLLDEMGDSPGDNEIVVVAAEVVTAPSPVVEAATLRQVSSPVESQEESQSQLECPICLQSCVHPVELPCKHIFCFLCIKGVAMQGPHGRCAICRSNIPHNVLTHPRLKDVSQLYKHVKTTSGYEWFYEARGGGELAQFFLSM